MKLLLDILKKPVAKLTLADLEAELVKATAAVAEAERAGAAAEAAYRAALLDPDPAVPIAARGPIGDAMMAHDRASALVTALNERLAAVRERDAEDARRRAYDAAKAQADGAADRLRREYPKLAGGIVSLITDLAAAEAAVVAVNASLPAGAAPLALPESSVRDVPARSRKVLNEAIVERWCRMDGTVIPIDWEKHVTSIGQGRHALHLPNTGALASASSPTAGEVVRRSFRRVEFQPSVPGAWVAPLATAVTLPGLEPKSSFWEPMAPYPFYPADVGGWHGELQAQRADWSAPLAPRIELEPINPTTGEVIGSTQALPPEPADARRTKVAA